MAEEQNVDFIVTAVDRATRVLQGIGTSFDGITKSYRSLQTLIAGSGVALGIQKIAAAAIESERATARLTAAIQATGHASGITGAELNEIAESLKRSTPFDDDEIRKGLAALTRFRDVQGDVFREAARLAPDLATALDTDVVSAYQRLGRALEDPEKGLRALREAGINVTGVQERVNQVMKETGDVAAAQKIILDELAKSVGGAAAGENAGLYGSIKGVEKAWDDVLKGLGKNEQAMNRMIRLARMTESALRFVGAIPETAGRAATSEERDIAAQGAAAQASARLIEGYQRDVNERIEKMQKEAAGREEKLRQEDIRGWVAHADEVFRLADEENLALARISEEHWAREEKLRQEDIKGWVAYAEEVFRLADEENLALARIADEANNRTKKAAQDLGFTFASAFENAIVKAEELRSILQGLAEDILRIFLRVNVTEPFAAALSSAFSGAFGGGGGGSGSYGDFATGGEFTVGGYGGTDSQTVSFRATPGERVTVMPPGQAGGGVTLVQNIQFSADTPAAVRAAVFSAAPALADMAVARMNDLMLRGNRV